MEKKELKLHPAIKSYGLDQIDIEMAEENTNNEVLDKKQDVSYQEYTTKLDAENSKENADSQQSKDMDIYKGVDPIYKVYLQYLSTKRTNKLHVYPHYGSVHGNNGLKITLPTKDGTFIVSMVNNQIPTVRGYNLNVRTIEDLVDLMVAAQMPDDINDAIAMRQRQINDLQELNIIYAFVDESRQTPLIDLNLVSTKMNIDMNISIGDQHINNETKNRHHNY